MSLYDNLIAYYKFESTLIDETGYHNLSDPLNAAYYISGTRSTAIQTGFYLQIQNTILQGTFDNGFSFLGWVKYNTSSGVDRHVFGIVNSTNNHIALRKLSNNTLTYALACQNITLLIPDVIEDNVFQHIAVICTPSGSNYDVKFYVNSVQKQTYDMNDGTLRSTVPKLASNLDFISNYLGRHPTIGSQAFNGALDDIKFYNVPKTYSDILKDYYGTMTKLMRLKYWNGTQYNHLYAKTSTPLQIKTKII